jgi:hypothetical protein
MKLIRTAALAAATLLVTAAFGQVAVPKVGPLCPSGFAMSGDYCVSNEPNAYAVPKLGPLCPFGFTMSGDYCVSNKPNAYAVPKTGPLCPSGFTMSGDYCVRE